MLNSDSPGDCHTVSSWCLQDGVAIIALVIEVLEVALSELTGHADTRWFLL